MSLREIKIQDDYRSDRDHLVSDFYIPCLEKSKSYDRAVGFFSSTSMAVLADGLTSFVRTGGKMRLVASPQLSEEDIEAIAQGLQQRDQVVENVVLQELEHDLEPLVRDRLACLAWLLAQGILEIKLAVPKNIRNQGIYHEKLGVFSDEDGNVIAFTGSANESVTALMDNFECLDVYASWIDGVKARAFRKADYFERLWNNGTSKVEVMEFPEAARRSLLKLKPRHQPSREPRVSTLHEKYCAFDMPHEDDVVGKPEMPEGLILRSYQNQAIANWFCNDSRGTLKMATGSGKTITALAITTQAHQILDLQAVIIVCPYRHLVTQWAKECEKFNLRPILAFESVKRWQGHLSSELYRCRSGSPSFLAVITTNATLMGAGFQSQLAYFPENTLLIGDEAHNFGSPQLIQSLPQSISYRLALSATPERYFDDIGTEGIYEYFGRVLEPEFTLRDAIAQGALVHYRYYPILISLTDIEAERYTLLTQKIRRLIGMRGLEDDHPGLTSLLLERSRLVGSAANKLVALKELMRDRLETSHTLFYCGDGSVEDAVSAESQRQLDVVARLLGRDLGYRVNTYSAETSLEARADLHELFESGELQGLVAIRCLDEGVDIPATQTAVILASSNNPRQFVQRRGRILRCHPNKKQATLFDMIVVPPAFDSETFEIDRQLLRREVTRFVEFADLSNNAGEARLMLLDLQKRYELLDL